LKKRIVTISGASGTGKSAIIRAQLNWASHLASLVLSTTMRLPRVKEPDMWGEYEYISMTEFELLESQDAFLWVMNVAGNKYGTKKSVLDEILQRDRKKIGLMILAPHTLSALKEYAPGQVYSFYILSPEESELKRRMVARGDSPETVESRIAERREWDEWALQNESIIDEYLVNNESILKPAARVLATIIDLSKRD